MGYWVIIILILTALLPSRIAAQSLPVGTPVLEEAYRRAQLLGQADSNVSFMVRPIFPSISFKQKSVFDPYGKTPDKQCKSTD